MTIPKKFNINVKVTFNPKSKVYEINSHEEHSVASSTLLYIIDIFRLK